MLKKLQIAAIAFAMMAGSLAVAAPARAQEIIIAPRHHHHHWMRVAERNCEYNGGVWTRGGCSYPGVARYRYNRFDYPGNVYYRDNGYYNNGYYRNGVWFRD